MYFFVISGILSYNGKVEILVGNLFWEWKIVFFHVRYMNYEVFSSHINYNFGLVKKFKRKRKVHFFWTFDILSCDWKVKILVGNLFCGWNCIFHVRYMNYEEFSSHINFNCGLVEKFKLKRKVHFFVISGILSCDGKVKILVGNLFWGWNFIFHVRCMNYEVFSSHINYNFGLVKKFKRKRKVPFFWTFDILSCDGKVKILVGNLFWGWNCIFHVRYMNYKVFSSHKNYNFGLKNSS